MSMSPEVQREYDAALLAATIQNGDIVAIRGRWGWKDFDALRHIGHMASLSDGQDSACRLIPAPSSTVVEDEWTEFEGSLYQGDKTHHGVVVYHVSCACGKLVDRSVRWEARAQEIAEAVFELAFGPLKS